MPSYPHLATDEIDWGSIDGKLSAMHTLGVPYDAQTLDHGPDLARAQAKALADEIAAQGGPTDLADKDVGDGSVARAADAQLVGPASLRRGDGVLPATIIAGDGAGGLVLENHVHLLPRVVLAEDLQGGLLLDHHVIGEDGG
jgi:hypothetical protein